MEAEEVLGLLPRRYVNVAAEATYNDDLPDALFRTYARLCGLAWQDTLHHHTHLPQLSLEDLAILCHRQAHAMSLHLRQLRNLGLITYVGNKNGYLIRILDPSRAEVSPVEAEQSFASTEQRFALTEQSFASPMMYDAVVDDIATGSKTQQQQQHHAEQRFASTEQRFASTEQSFALTEQSFALPMMYDAVVDDIATGSKTQQQQQHHAEQRFASTEQRFASTEQRFASTEQRFASPEQRFASTEQRFASTEQRFASTEQRFASTEQRFASTEQRFASTEQTEARIRANLAALSAWGVNPATAPARAVAAFPHLTPELIHAWGAELQQRAQVRNLPGLLLYTLRTTTQEPRAETRGGTRGALSAAELPAPEPPPGPVPAAPGLPEAVLADLAELGWTGAVDEVLEHWLADPERVQDWLEHWLNSEESGVRSRAALFRQSLRSGAPAPAVPVAPDAPEAGERYVTGAYADFIQH